MRFSTSITMLIGAITAVSAAPAPAPVTAMVLPEPLVQDHGNVTSSPLDVSSLSARDQPPWKLSTWSGFNCNSGEALTWSTPYSTYKGCINMANVHSLSLNSYGTCDTYFYDSENCPYQTASINGLNSCLSFSDGRNIRSVYVYCKTS